MVMAKAAMEKAIMTNILNHMETRLEVQLLEKEKSEED